MAKKKFQNFDVNFFKIILPVYKEKVREKKKTFLREYFITF
jgi:hypothetical protein